MGDLAEGLKYVMIGIGIAGVAAGAVVFSVPGYFIGKSSGVDNERVRIASMRLSERKANDFWPDQREDAFMKQVVPTFGLKRDSLEYNVLHTACVTGVYGSKADDFKVPAERVKTTYELCGWKAGR